MDVALLRCREWAVSAEVQGHARVASANAAKTKHGNPYLSFTLHDGDGTSFAAKQFGSSNGPPTSGAVLFIRATVDDYDGPLSLKITQWQEAPEVPHHHFLRQMPHDRRSSMADLDALITGISDEPLRALVEAVFTDGGRDRFAIHPAAKVNHGAVAAGLLTHTVRVTQMALALSAFVPMIDRELLLAAALLHDVGKLDELQSEPGADLTERGKLLGHVTLGLLKVQAVAATIPDLSEERRDLLLHVIQAAHGKREYGAPVVPSTFEALVLSLADSAESTIEIGLEAVERMPGGTSWTPHVKQLGTWFRGPGSCAPEGGQLAGLDQWPEGDEVPF